MGKAFPVPLMLRWARESIHYSIEEVARKIGKKPEVIKDWETGKDFPTYRQLEKLAEIYKRPVAVFFFPEPPLEQSPKEQFRTLPDFMFEALSPTIVKLIRKARTMCENLKELCDGKNPARRNIVQDISIELGSSLPDVANQVRSYLGITLEEQIGWSNSKEAFSNWRDAIEECGVFVFKDAFRDDTVSGFCLYDREFPLIYVNNSMWDTRQIFTLFHEMAHLLFRTGGIDQIDDAYVTALDGYKKGVEVFCNAFAAEFLVPDYDFDQCLSQCRKNNILSYVPELAQRYSVSHEVILRKLLNRKLISQSTYEQRAREGNRASDSSGGNYYNNLLTYLGHRYLDLAFTKYYRNQISIYELAAYLGVKKINAIHRLEMALGR